MQPQEFPTLATSPPPSVFPANSDLINAIFALRLFDELLEPIIATRLWQQCLIALPEK